MVTFDTQKLYIGYQLEQMDAAAAASALQDMVARRKTTPANGPKPNTLELVDQYEENQVRTAGAVLHGPRLDCIAQNMPCHFYLLPAPVPFAHPLPSACLNRPP